MTSEINDLTDDEINGNHLLVANLALAFCRCRRGLPYEATWDLLNGAADLKGEGPTTEDVNWARYVLEHLSGEDVTVYTTACITKPSGGGSR